MWLLLTYCLAASASVSGSTALVTTLLSCATCTKNKGHCTTTATTVPELVPPWSQSTSTLRMCLLNTQFINYSSFLTFLASLLLAGSATGSSAGIVFTHAPNFGFFAPQGRHVAPIKIKFDLDRSRGGGLRPPKLKNWNFTNIIAAKGRVPCTIFYTKFTSFMRVLSLHNFAKCGCFISINGKIINKITSMGAFSAKFSTPPSSKIMDWTHKSLDLKWWHGPPLSPCTSAWEDEMCCFSPFF